jgi:hypothetical protein
VNAAIDIPITGSVNEITQELSNISEIPIKVQLEQTICYPWYEPPFYQCTTVKVTVYDDSIGGWTIGSTVLQPAISVDNSIAQAFDFPGSGTLGPYTFGFGFQQSPGFFNSTTTPSSGFFNSGGGGASGLFNSATGSVSGLANDFANTSGLANGGGPGNSGYINEGELVSGFANLGNTISGGLNTSTLGLATAANVSGFVNIGTNLSGFFNNVSLP